MPKKKMSNNPLVSMVSQHNIANEQNVSILDVEREKGQTEPKVIESTYSVFLIPFESGIQITVVVLTMNLFESMNHMISS